MTQARVGIKIPPGFSLDVDFEIPGGITAVYGPSGSGKTLILEAIAGLYAPHSGRVLLDDAILFDAEAGVNVPPERRRCGYIAQNDSLFPHMSVRQNLAFAAPGLSRLERHRRAAAMLERFGIVPLARERPNALGAEQKLRCAAARAALAEPKLLLLDERDWTEGLLELVRGTVMCPIVMATRDLDLACAAASTLILLEGGRIVQRGTPRAVLDAPDSVESARLLGISNLLEGTIAALDPGRNTSRLEFDGFALNGPYIPAHFRGDRVWVAIRADEVRVHSGEIDAIPNALIVELVRVSERARSVRLEFAPHVVADVPLAWWAMQKDNKSWQVEFPPDSLKVL